MGLFRKRNIQLKTRRTTIAMEVEFWSALDFIASKEGVSWHDWIIQNTDIQSNGRASKVRIGVLNRLINSCQKGGQNG